MPIKAVEFHDEASAEYDAAFDWYLKQSSDAASNFDAEVDRALADIASSPQRLATCSAHKEKATLISERGLY